MQASFGGTVCGGDRITDFQLSIEYKLSEGANSGIIAFQLHSGGKTEVRFRNIRLEVTEPESGPNND